MRINWKLLVICFLSVICIPVVAKEHNLKEVVPIEETISVSTELFQYEDISYVSSIEGKDYGRISFKSIKNLSSSSSYVSIDILLFDAKKENLGLISYCSEQDVSGNYSLTKLHSGESTEFYINVTDKYLVAGKSPSDVAYYAVYDDNKYCHVGGYTKYEGLTIEEINAGVIKRDDVSDLSGGSLLEQYRSIPSSFWGIFIVGFLIAYILQAFLYNALHKKMYGRYTGLVFVPIANQYIAVKMAFGDMVAKIYIVLLVLSVPLSFMGITSVVSWITQIISSVAFFMVLYKLFNKQYRTNTNDIPQALPDQNNDVSGENAIPPAENNDVSGKSVTSSVEHVSESFDQNGVINESVSTIPVQEQRIKPEEQNFENKDVSLENQGETSQSSSSQMSAAEGESELMNLFK